MPAVAHPSDHCHRHPERLQNHEQHRVLAHRLGRRHSDCIEEDRGADHHSGHHRQRHLEEVAKESVGIVTRPCLLRGSGDAHLASLRRLLASH